MLRMLLWSWTNDADAEPPVTPVSGEHYKYRWARKVRHWKAYKPKNESPR